MQRVGKKLVSGRYTRFILLVVLLTIIFLLNTIALFTIFTSQGHFVIWDFHPILLAGQAVMQGIDPYSSEVTEAIQALDYGRLAKPGEDVQAFAYPLFVAILQIPFALMPLQWAQAAWLSLLEGVTLTAVVMLPRLWNESGHYFFRGSLIAWSLIFYPIVWGLILGQIALLVFFLMVLSVWAITKQQDYWGGFALGLTFIKPTISFLIIPGILIWALVIKRWRVIGGAISASILIIGLPTIIQPNWISQFWQRLTEYRLYSQFPPPFELLLQACFPKASVVIGPLISIALLGILVYGWIRAIQKKSRIEFLWAVGLTLIITTIIAPRTHIINQVVLLLPIFGIIEGLRRYPFRGIIVSTILLIFWGGVLWLLSFLPPISTSTPRYLMEHRVLSPILPLSLGLVWIFAHLIFTRAGGFKHRWSFEKDLDPSGV